MQVGVVDSRPSLMALSRQDIAGTYGGEVKLLLDECARRGVLFPMEFATCSDWIQEDECHWQEAETSTERLSMHVFHAMKRYLRQAVNGPDGNPMQVFFPRLI